jgi:hypothetical protein
MGWISIDSDMRHLLRYDKNSYLLDMPFLQAISKNNVFSYVNDGGSEISEEDL